MTWINTNKSIPENNQRVLTVGKNCLYPVIAVYLNEFEFNDRKYEAGFYLDDGIEPLDWVEYWHEIPPLEIK